MKEIIDTFESFLKGNDETNWPVIENDYQRYMNYKDNLEDMGRRGILSKEVASKCASYYETKAKSLNILNVKI